MDRLVNRAMITVLLLAAAGLAGCGPREIRGTVHLDGVRGTIVEVDDATPPEAIDRLRLAPDRARSPLYLWIDVGRNPRLAGEHPEWIAGMGSHGDWRRLFPSAPVPGPGQRIGVYPWVPIWYRDVLEDRRAAIVRLLQGRTDGIAGVFLHHVQGAPSACGCGNDQCRWTADYRMGGGPAKVEGSPAALLIAALKKDLPGVEWIPVWLIECEEHDMPGEDSTGYCGEVGCFTGLCWKASSKELDALLKATDGPIGVLVAAEVFHRKLPRYMAAGGWAAEVVKDLAEIPPRHGGPVVPADRLILVDEWFSTEIASVLGWNAERLGARGIATCPGRLRESWEPRLIPAVSGGEAGGGEEPDGHGHAPKG